MFRSRIFWLIIGVFAIGIVLSVLGFRSTKLHISVAAEPVYCVGGVRATLESCASGFPVTNSLIMTVVVNIVLAVLVFAGARNLQMVPRGLQNIIELVIETLYSFGQSIDRKNINKFFPFCASVFIFFLISNFLGLVPGVGSIGVCAVTPAAEARVASLGAVTLAAEEGPTGVFDSFLLACESGTTLVPALRATSADLNVTFAWSLVAWVLIQFFAFQALGPGYLSKFFNFREGFIGGLVGFIELISEFIRIPAFALRLFGNIFAGEVLLVVMSFLFMYGLPAPFYAFEFFVAFIQAVIFAVLALVFMSQATKAHGGHDDHGKAEHAH